MDVSWGYCCQEVKHPIQGGHLIKSFNKLPQGSYCVPALSQMTLSLQFKGETETCFEST